jgi:predicted kinase
MKKIQVLVGMIASGKTSYAHEAAKKGIICVNDDAIYNMIHANNYNLYNKDCKILYKSIENHIISQALCMGKTVLVDRGLNVSKRGRQRYIALAKSFDVNIEAITFENEGYEIHGERRFNSESRGLSRSVWLNCALAHSKIWAYPTLDEGFSSVKPIKFEEIKQGKVFI